MTTPESPRTSLAQKRAHHALGKVTELAGTDKKEVEEVYGHYVSYVQALPPTIMRNGLGQALAMERAGAKRIGHKILFGHICDWLTQGWETSPYRGDPKLSPDAAGLALLQAMMGGQEADYLRAQAETLEYLEWLKKFAVAYLVNPEDPADAASKTNGGGGAGDATGSDAGEAGKV